MSEGAAAVKFELVHDDGSYRVGRQTKKNLRKKKSDGYRRARARRCRAVQDWLQRYKAEHPCACGERNPVALDLHHKGEYKTQNMSRMRTLHACLKELPFRKGVCANCYRKLHGRQQRANGRVSFWV
jgi:hypothetical protein